MRPVRRILMKAVGLGWAWFKRPKNLIACFVFAVGFPGFLGDIGEWLVWIDKAITATLPFLPDLRLTKVADFLASEWSRWGALGLALFIFEIDKIRLVVLWVFGRAGYAVAVVSNKQHFISRGESLKIVQRSDWGRSRKRKSQPGMTIGESFQKAILSIDPSAADRQKMYEAWCGMVLDKFESQIEDSTKVVDGNKEYDEGTLRDWLDGRYGDDVIHEFGEP